MEDLKTPLRQLPNTTLLHYYLKRTPINEELLLTVGLPTERKDIKDKPLR